jgi:hypothetical protein
MKKRNKKYRPQPCHVSSVFLHMMDRAGIETPQAVLVDVNEDGSPRVPRSDLIQGEICYGNTETKV